MITDDYLRDSVAETTTCDWCENELGDEFHFLMNCSNFKTFRNQLIKRHHTIRSSCSFYIC